MTRIRVLAFVGLLALAATTYAAANPAGGSKASDEDRAKTIKMRDDCDPRDPAWDTRGGCVRERGDVTFAEFGGENDSPLAASVIGHQAWRNDPSYLEVTAGTTVRIKNAGGRPHTFTNVAAFGGGVAAPTSPVNEGLQRAPECPESTIIPAGDSATLPALAAGNHRFMCCLHPWMRALVKVKPDRERPHHPPPVSG